MQEHTHIGLDVHKDTIAGAVLRPGTTSCEEWLIPNTPEALRKLLSSRRDCRRCSRAGVRGEQDEAVSAARATPKSLAVPAAAPGSACRP
jgi:hypothetical protein